MIIQLVGYTEPYDYSSVVHRIANGFTDNGHTVIKTDRNNIVIDDSADFVFYIDCSQDFSLNMPETDKPTVFWSFDAHMPQGVERSSNIGRKCDLIFATQYEHGVKLLQKFGMEAMLLPFTYDAHVCIPQDKKTLDVVMIGNNNSPAREALWKELKQYNSFVGTTPRVEDYINNMGSAKICVNQPTLPWDIIITNRFYEGMGAGAMVLSMDVKTSIAEKLGFIDGVHYVKWYDFKDLNEKIQYYLKHNDLREKIAQAGHELCKQYDMRAQCHVIETIVLNKFYERIK